MIQRYSSRGRVDIYNLRYRGSVEDRVHELQEGAFPPRIKGGYQLKAGHTKRRIYL